VHAASVPLVWRSVTLDPGFPYRVLGLVEVTKHDEELAHQAAVACRRAARSVAYNTIARAYQAGANTRTAAEVFH
jgi:hypothetical protein